jgi:hypothetical protein
MNSTKHRSEELSSASLSERRRRRGDFYSFFDNSIVIYLFSSIISSRTHKIKFHENKKEIKFKTLHKKMRKNKLEKYLFGRSQPFSICIAYQSQTKSGNIMNTVDDHDQLLTDNKIWLAELSVLDDDSHHSHFNKKTYAYALSGYDELYLCHHSQGDRQFLSPTPLIDYVIF